MKTWQNLLVQILAMIGQAGNVFSGIVPAKWQPLVAFLLGLCQLVAAYFAHQSNPDGTPASTAYVKPSNSTSSTAPVIILGLLLFPLTLQAQTAPATGDITKMFSTGTTATALHIAGETNPGTDIFAQFVVKQNGDTHFIARTDSLLVPGNNWQGYYGGAGISVSLDKLIKNTNLPQGAFQAYTFLEGGIARNVPASGTAISKPSFYTHGGINYDPTKTKNFTINLFDAGFVYAPNLGYPAAHSNGWTLSVGIAYNPWTAQQ